jgi:hypothetical protein
MPRLRLVNIHAAAKTVPIEEGALPPDIISRASLRGNEYAWPVETIPEVIEAARPNALVNIGGQLQFRFADGRFVSATGWRPLPT